MYCKLSCRELYKIELRTFLNYNSIFLECINNPYVITKIYPLLLLFDEINGVIETEFAEPIGYLH